MSTARLLAICTAVVPSLLACGDNLAPPPPPPPLPLPVRPEPVPARAPALAPAHDLVIAAHQDDDLLFMEPDVTDLVRDGVPITVVYVTAGDGSAGLAYADQRALAVRVAYATVAGLAPTAWTCGTIELDGHAAQHCRLDGGAVSLVFLGYPDGGINGDRPTSLLQLWQGTVAGADTIAHQVTHYDQNGLVDAVARIIAITQPVVIHTLDLAATHGGDHADHTIVGALTVVARARAGSDAALLAYRGYNDYVEPENLAPAAAARGSLAFRAYEACQIPCGACGVTPCKEQDLLRSYAGWLHRRYAVGTRRTLHGRLALGDRCAVIMGGDGVGLGDCDGAAHFELDAVGRLHVGDACVEARTGGTLATGGCAARAERSFVVDDEGHIWAGVLPPASAAMQYDHAMCLLDDGDRVRAGLCGAHRDPRWTVLPATIAGPRGLAGDGRAIRFGAIDRAPALCDVEAGVLTCTRATADGGFASVLQIGATDGSFAIDADTLVLADVDGDGRGDACGRFAGGILCATAALGFATTQWSAAFAHAGVATVGDRTLTGLDLDDDGTAELCALTDHGLACAARGGPAATVIGAPSAPAGALLTGDLDGDGRDDWCISTAAGPMCEVAAERDLTPGATSWAFSQGGAVEGSAAVDGVIATPDRAALVDVSDDGRADLCTLSDDRVDCAISQGRSFGPRMPMLRLPAGHHATALWAGSIDGAGELCVDDGDDVVCARF